MYYLRRYIQEDPKRKARLLARYRKINKTPLDLSTLWRHISLRTEPPGSMLLFYLSFLHRESAINPGQDRASGLFTYTFPELLRPVK